MTRIIGALTVLLHASAGLAAGAMEGNTRLSQVMQRLGEPGASLASTAMHEAFAELDNESRKLLEQPVLDHTTQLGAFAESVIALQRPQPFATEDDIAKTVQENARALLFMLVDDERAARELAYTDWPHEGGTLLIETLPLAIDSLSRFGLRPQSRRSGATARLMEYEGSVLGDCSVMVAMHRTLDETKRALLRVAQQKTYSFAVPMRRETRTLAGDIYLMGSMGIYSRVAFSRANVVVTASCTEEELRPIVEWLDGHIQNLAQAGRVSLEVDAPVVRIEGELPDLPVESKPAAPPPPRDEDIVIIEGPQPDTPYGFVVAEDTAKVKIVVRILDPRVEQVIITNDVDTLRIPNQGRIEAELPFIAPRMVVRVVAPVPEAVGPNYYGAQQSIAFVTPAERDRLRERDLSIFPEYRER